MVTEVSVTAISTGKRKLTPAYLESGHYARSKSYIYNPRSTPGPWVLVLPNGYSEGIWIIKSKNNL